jgi:RNA polymerase sigma factor (sigma-70 family)
MTAARDTRTPFLPTRWSLVHRAQGNDTDAEQALAELCETYWFPLYGWTRRSGSSPADAEDLVQSFFHQILRKQLFHNANAAKGRLRTFLLTAFRRHARDVYEKAQHRGGVRLVSFDAMAGEEWYLADTNSSSTPDAFFDRQWALTVLDVVLTRLGSDYEKRGKAADFARLQKYLTNAVDPDYEADAEALGISSGAVKVAVHRLRERFREALRDEVASLQDDTQDIDEELLYLLSAMQA